MKSPAEHIGRKIGYSSLGKLISTHMGIGIGSRTWIFIILPTSAAIIFALVFGTLIAWQNYLKHGPASALHIARPWYFAAIILVILLLLYSIYRLLCSLRRIYIFEEGIVYRNLLFFRRQYYWSEIKGITSSAQAITFYNRHIRTEPIGIIHPKSGRLIKLTKRFQNIPHLIQELKTMFYPQIWANVKSNYFSGRVINFGRISISNNQISISGIPLSWESIKRIKVESGDVLIELHGRNQYRVPVSAVQNLELLFQLVNLGISG